MELPDLVLEVINLQFIEHDDVVTTVIAQEALEADRAEASFTESLDVFTLVEFALAKILFAVRD